MNAARAAIAAAVLMMGVWANLNPEIIDDWIDAYDVYFKQLIGIDINGCNNDTLQFIKSLDNEM